MAGDSDEFECPIKAERYEWLTGGPLSELQELRTLNLGMTPINRILLSIISSKRENNKVKTWIISLRAIMIFLKNLLFGIKT